MVSRYGTSRDAALEIKSRRRLVDMVNTFVSILEAGDNTSVSLHNAFSQLRHIIHKIIVKLQNIF